MKLESLESTKGLIARSPSSEDLRTRASMIMPEPTRLFYGETYDEKGHPIDSMKYYLFLSYLADSLRNEGFNVDPSVLVADSAACRNVGDEHKEYYMALGDDRAKFVGRVNEIYKTNLRVVKMSDYINTPEFIEKRQSIMSTCEADEGLMRAVEKTVPESKLEVEREKGFMYSFDEIATIFDLDLKVGPPREDLYDEVARKIARDRGQKELISLFLTPTFPLGMNWSYFFSNEGIEDHGITAYKAGSKRLQRHRIIVEKSNPDYIRELVASSFVSKNPVLPNAVLDVGIICEMARKRLEEDDSPITLADDFYNGEITEVELKEKVSQGVEKYVLSRFR